MSSGMLPEHDAVDAFFFFLLLHALQQSNSAFPFASLISFVLVANVISNGKNCPQMAILHNCISTGFNIKRHSLKSSGTMLVSLFLFLKPNKFASVKQQKCIRDIMGEPLMPVCNLQTPQLHCIQKSK